MDVVEMVIQMEKKEARLEERKKVSKEKDTFYVENMLRQTDCTDEKIAELVGVTLSFVGKVRKKLVLKNRM